MSELLERLEILAAKLEPLSLAIFFLGATALAVVWLAARVVKGISRK